jgi:arylformamidase
MTSKAEFYDREYNPRLLVRDPAALFAGWAVRSKAARDELRGHVDLAYGAGSRETLDLYPAAPNAPLLVFIHGGFWRFTAKEDYLWLVPPFLAAGISVALVEYELAPKVSLTTINDQSLRAIAWLHAHADAYGYRRDRIVVSGHSAGGQLAAMSACADWPRIQPGLPADVVHAVLAISGLFELQPVQETPYLKAELRMTDEEVARFSPVFHTPRPGLPVVTAVGADESDEFKRQTALLAQCWPGNVKQQLSLANAHHYTACELLADPNGPLFQAAVGLCRA